ncbi:MAG: lysN 1 [Firmicutes bacterium]|nr:lysN 1 [Bacillota bacterium]
MDTFYFFNSQILDQNLTTPLYLQIAELITGKIETGEIPAGTKLPPERELSTLLGVSRTTTINAYRYLEKQGIVNIKIGSGTYVIRHTFQTNPPLLWNQLFTAHAQTPAASILKELVSAKQLPENISLAAGMPNPTLYPIELFSQLYTENIGAAEPSEFGLIATEGYMPLRTSVSDMLTKKAITVTPDNVLILSGSQQGLYLVGKAFLEPGDYVIVESPTYIGAIQTFQSLGARLLTVPASKNLDLAQIEDYIIRYRPKLFYILPTFQNPSGQVLSLQNRQQLIQLAARHRLVIIEDDTYGDLYYDSEPPPPIKALDSYEGVLYLGTASKILFPGLRIGWIVGPQEVIQRLAFEKQYIDLHSNNITQWLLHKFLAKNLLDNHLTKVRTTYLKNRNIAIDALRHYAKGNFKFSIPDGGLYLWGTVQGNCSTKTLLHEAARHGVSFVPGEVFYATPPDLCQARLCFTTTDSELLAEGIRRFAAAINSAIKTTPQKKTTVSASMPII